MDERFDFEGRIIWRPTHEDIERAHLTHFMRHNGLHDFQELMQRSTLDIAWFTEAILKYLDVRFFRPFSKVVDLSRGPAWPSWCVDGQLNIVYNCLDKYIGTPVEDRTALIWEGEEGQVRTLKYGELYKKVNQAANALRSLGLGKGDAIGLFMPMIPENVIALLAIARIGGIILPLFSGFGAGAIATRLSDGEAKALFTSDGAFRNGKPVPMKLVVDQAIADVPSLRNVIVFNRVGLPVETQVGLDHSWDALVSTQPEVSPPEITGAEDILMVIHTSGTTGQPKGAVHTHCGFPVKAAQDMAFGIDIHPGDILYWMTDMGWMMGPWLVFGTLLLGGTMFLYDGAPDFPGPDRLWAIVERHHITSLGVSPTLVRSLVRHGVEPVRKHDLSSLRVFASTGEPWNPDPWLWLFHEVGEGKRPIINYSGGTELSGGIVMSNPILPIKPCAFSAPCPGIAADVFDENGKPVRGQVGELVIKAPWIGMTRGLWKDPQRFIETYWSHWPNVWVHGDFAMIDKEGQWYILGRSDDTIKLAGKRLGPAEVESILVSHPNVVEAAVVGIPHEIKGNELVAFCVLSKDCDPCEDLRRELKDLLVQSLGKPFTPRAILFVRDLPKTRNAKVMRRMIRAAYLGENPGDTSSLVNPEAVEEIRQAR